MSALTHFDSNGNAAMVDVGGKSTTTRTAVAVGRIRMSAECYRMVREGSASKGDVLGVARVAGIMATKQTPALIPLCHTLLLEKSAVEFDFPGNDEIEARCTVKTTGTTGVEMEALTGATIALLTIYDMCKAVDRGMELYGVHLAEKTGGKSGHHQHPKREAANGKA